MNDVWLGSFSKEGFAPLQGPVKLEATRHIGRQIFDLATLSLGADEDRTTTGIAIRS